jgi:CRISPR-associated protein Csx10
MKVITYRIKLLEPVLATTLDGDPNSATAFDFLPGSVLRGAIIGKYLQRNRQSRFDAANETEQGLFFSGATRYLNGYPLDRLNNRCLPTPLSWKQDKDEVAKREKNNPAPIFDFALGELDEIEQEQSVASPFCWLSSDEVRLVSPARQLAVHTARTRRFGRAMPGERIGPDEEPGAVYRYEALAARQTFEAVILCDRDDDAADLHALLDGEARLGGSRSGGYGRAQFEAAQILKTSWREVSGAITYNGRGPLIVTLLSDASLRDGNGQFSTDSSVLETMLKDRLGCELKLRQAFSQSRVSGGFNRKWGLPLTQAFALSMGSTYVFAPTSCDVNKLRDLENEGIGERRAEGFGRMAINWNKEEELTIDTTPSQQKTVTFSLSPTSRETAQRMAERLLRQRLDRAVTAKANELTGRLKGDDLPHRSQLSRLRRCVHDALLLAEPQPQGIGEFLKSVEARHITRRQWERAKIDGQRLLDWLDEKRKITNQEEWEKLLGLKKPDYLRPVAGVVPEPNKLRNEYLLRLIDAVLARSAKLKGE